MALKLKIHNVIVFYCEITIILHLKGRLFVIFAFTFPYRMQKFYKVMLKLVGWWRHFKHRVLCYRYRNGGIIVKKNQSVLSTGS